MSVFQNSDQLYGFFRMLIERIERDNSQAAESMLKSGIRFRFCFEEPTAEVRIDARQRPLQIEYGNASQKSDLDITLTTETLHQILLGNLSLRKAIGSKQIKPKGPVWKTAVLADLFSHAQTIYPELLKDLDIIL